LVVWRFHRHSPPGRSHRRCPWSDLVSSGSPDDQRNLTAATRRGLNEAGYVEGQNLTIEYRWAEGRYDRLPGLAAELVNRQVALIIAAGGSDPGRAAKAATSTIPIVFITAADPVTTGIIASLSRPEGNVTGINMIGASLEGKRLELLREVVPQASIMGVLINPKYPRQRSRPRKCRRQPPGSGRNWCCSTPARNRKLKPASPPCAEGRSRAGLQRPVLRIVSREARGFGAPP
jgi:putative ABC transport system substrate-binding protein